MPFSNHALGTPRPDSGPPMQRNVGVELRELRTRIPLSQAEAAFICGVDVSTISRWERGAIQHTHRTKDRRLRWALSTLRRAVWLIDLEPDRVLTFEDLLDYMRRTRPRDLEPVAAVSGQIGAAPGATPA